MNDMTGRRWKVICVNYTHIKGTNTEAVKALTHIWCNVLMKSCDVV